MSKQYSANSKENEEIKNLLNQLKEKDTELIEAFEEHEPFSKIREIEIEYEKLANQINTLYAELNLDHRVRTSYEEEQIDTARGKFFTEYRSQLNQTRIDETQSLEDSTQITPILPQGKTVKFQLKPSILTFDPTKPEHYKQSPAHSTPFKPSDSCANPDDIVAVKQKLENVISELSKEFEPELVQSFFEDKNNLDLIDRTLKEEVEEKNIFTRLKDRIYTLTAHYFEQKELLNSGLDTSGEAYKSAIDNNFLQQFDNNNTLNMANPLAIRGLSVKDALDLIPRFNGANIPLSQFLDGCVEAKNVIPVNLEKDFVKLIRIRLYGEALNITRTQSFDDLKALSDFFEKMFGSAKIFYDLMGELAKIRQESSESVVIYLN